MTPSGPPPFSGLPAAARGLILGACASAAAGLAVSVALAQPMELDVLLFVLAGGLCAAANLFEVFAPGQFSLQPNLVFFFAAATMLPPWAVAALACASFLPGWFVHRFRWYMVACNIANYAVAGLAVHWIVRAFADLNGPAADGRVAMTLLLAAVVFVLVNHVLVCSAAALSRGRALRDALTLDETRSGVPVDLALAATGACLAVLWAQAPAQAALAAGPVGLVYIAVWVPLLRHKSRRDPKTGLFNSEHFARLLADALEHARRHDEPASLVMLDLDHLRAVNNRFGHLTGDELIRAVAGVLEEACGRRGLASRFGGEEYCLLLPGADAAEATAIAERVRLQVSELRLRTVDSRQLRPTISAGIAVFPDHAADPEELLRAADVAVYDAKLGGRDRVRVALPSGSRELLALEDLPERPSRSARIGVAASSPADETLRAVADEAEAATAGPGDVERPTGSSRLSRYIGALCALAVLVAAPFGFEALAQDPWLALGLVAACVILDFVAIDLFERGHLSPALVPVIALAGLFGPAGPLVAEGAILLSRLARRTPARKALFDFGSLSLAGSAAAAGFLVTHHGWALVLAGALAGFAYYAVNTPLFAIVVSLAQGRPAIDNWREQLAWLGPHFVAMGTVGGLFLIAEEKLGLNAFLVFGIPIGLIWLAEKQYLDRSRASVAELRRSHAELERANGELRRALDDNERLVGRIHRSYLSTITSLARTIEAKDPYTSGHTERVATLASDVARELGFERDDLRAIEVGAVIHDIGKIGIRDELLLKRGPLEPDERLEMQRHPEISSYILADLDLPPIVKQMVRAHHERYDGTGYPDRLTGDEIPLAARILSVVDAFDAMTSNRPYRRALPAEHALQAIDEGAGTQFCPAAARALRACLDREVPGERSTGQAEVAQV